MVIDIKMCRFDNVPWGFRLVGGADYEYPLTVVKVAEGSIAEEAGLRVEDVIVRINDTAATPLTHDEAHRLIMSSGSVFYFGVHREAEEEEVYQGPRRFPLRVGSLTKSPTPEQLPTAAASASTSASPLPLPSLTEATKAFIPEQEQVEVAQLEANVELECRSALTEMHSHDKEQQQQQQRQEENGVNVDSLYLPDLPDRPCSAMSEQTEIKLVEEEIAAVLSGESEVLKEHNVLGIFPKPGVCMTSDVLRSLNEEVTKTKLEKEKENRKWSTFLQRPDRPVPKSKQQLEAERRAANAYKVKIVKSAPRDKSPMPEAKPAPKEATPPPADEGAKGAEAKAEAELEEPLPTDSEVPNLEQLPDNGNNDLPEEPEGEQLEKAHASQEEPDDNNENKEEEQPATEGDEQTAPAEPNEQQPEGGPGTPPKTEEELALEKQLADVQKQLAALSSLPSTIQSTLDAVTKQLAELLPTFKLQQEQQQQQQPQIDVEEQAELTTDGGEQPGEYEDMSEVGKRAQSGEEEATACENNEDKCDDANDLEVAEISLSNGDNRQLEEQLNEEQCFKRQKIAFWNRLFNGEHITRQRFRELQSLSVARAAHRVNFMKYQKPERKIDLNRSEVYKVIHHLDRAPVRGIEVRAPLVAAESDIRQALQS